MTHYLDMVDICAVVVGHGIYVLETNYPVDLDPRTYKPGPFKGHFVLSRCTLVPIMLKIQKQILYLILTCNLDPSETGVC